ncbi:MAG: hypothetical protein M1825_002532 [Sarcosagium campestre]|nr:MAG: hypothetical protein M1825_002532 [Sarcosagium campestre]
MNASAPVTSSIESVDFSFLGPRHIKKRSVKRIENPITFDSLEHPNPSGLYDLALGAWGDRICTTCNLASHMCPGHCGHIELPVPVYHPVFMPLILQLLRAKCPYCHHLRPARLEIHRYICKFRLLHHGLIVEAADLDSLKVRSGDGGVDSDSDASESDDDNEIVRMRLQFVTDAIRKAQDASDTITGSSDTQGKDQALFEGRNALVKDFLKSIQKSKNCATCHGISPKYRKDKFVKIFRMALSSKDKEKMTMQGIKSNNAIVELKKQESRMKKRQKRSSKDIDEGIVVDGDEDDEEGDSVEEEGETIEPEDTGGFIVDESAFVSTTQVEKPTAKQTYMNAGEVQAALTLLFQKEKEIMSLFINVRDRSGGLHTPDPNVYFVQMLQVPPNRYRPAEKSAGKTTEAPQNSLYKGILTQCENMNVIGREIREGPTKEALARPNYRKRDFIDLQEAWVRLQDAVNSLIDSDRNPMMRSGGQTNVDGIKQKLEKKEGLFRKNMMGKRVNFSARSVISPDPNIDTNEIGIPPVFAKVLTYPEPVTNHNFYILKEAVLNGPTKWPGANAIEDENGHIVRLKFKTVDERQALANQLLAPSSGAVKGNRNKKVHRHLNNGDVVLMNRQPTLHKPSMMSHRVKVLSGEKTIRMHYANCNTYNADFDGDEMNLHFPQNEIARAEAVHIADTDHQYLVATSGKPLRGLIQDHISMGLALTNRDTFFSRSDYQQLLYNCLRPEDGHTTSGTILTMRPAILKPRPLWTGKQVISTIMKNIQPQTHPGLTLTSKSSTIGAMWGPDSEEGRVIIQDGLFLTGILDKAQIGPAAGGMVHSVYEVYGHTIAGKLLNALGRLLTKYLSMRAHTCGMDDLTLSPAGERARLEKLAAVKDAGLKVAAKYVTLDSAAPRADDPELLSRLEAVLRDGDKQVGLDRVMNTRTQDISSAVEKVCLPNGLTKPFPRNSMQAMTTSGAKGSQVNANQISCNLGQQVLEGRRVPIMASGKSLPCYKPFETDVRAGGYVTGRFMTGITPQEFFFHCMAGREGLIDTAVKTSSSGYLQHCLVKCMEGLKVEYDSTVRDADGSMVQFLYGEDGLDVTKQKHLVDFKFIADNFYSFFEQLKVRDDYLLIATDIALEHMKKAIKKVKKSGRIDAMDPTLAIYPPGRYPNSTSETFYKALKKYEDENPDKLITDKKGGIEGVVKKKNFETLMNLKYLKSTVEPGEAVGIVASQSIGEPSTQMTLNTFHLAGHSAKNVTLGIPRLREILMTASANMKTPTMTMDLNPELSEAEGKRFAKGISKLSLAELVDEVTVRESIGPGKAYPRAKIFDIKIDLFPSTEYCEEYAITVEDCITALEWRFVPRLTKNIKSELKKKSEAASLKTAATNDAVPEIGQSARTIRDGPSRAARSSGDGAEGNNDKNDDDEEDDGDDDDDDEGDGEDATNAKQKSKRNQSKSYAAPDEEEQNIAIQAIRETSPAYEMEDEGIGGSPAPETPRGYLPGEEELDDAEPNSRTNEMRQNAASREARLMSSEHDVTRFQFDDVGGQWCRLRLEYPAESPKVLMLAMVESVLHKTLIQGIPGVDACTFTKDKRKDPLTLKESEHPVVVSAGVNLVAMHQHQEIINPHRIFTNDIVAMLRHYGVEACRGTIISELNAVFGSHGISVDNRHLNLIADMMTRNGGFQPFNRTGIKSNTSTFLKASFETTLGFLRDAVLEQDWDDLSSPSARIVVGRVGKVGTGAFDVMMPLAGS